MPRDAGDGTGVSGEGGFGVTGAGGHHLPRQLEPDDGAIAIGAGGTYAYAAAKALLDHTTLSAREIAAAAMAITARICIYTNDTLLIEEVGDEGSTNDEVRSTKENGLEEAQAAEAPSDAEPR